MRALYAPSPSRLSPQTRALMDELLPDSVAIEPGSANHAMFGAVAAVYERVSAQLSRLDTTPWNADVRFPSAARQAQGLERSLPEAFDVYGPEAEAGLLYGAPASWTTELRRRWVVEPVYNDFGERVEWAVAVEGSDAAGKETVDPGRTLPLLYLQGKATEIQLGFDGEDREPLYFVNDEQQATRVGGSWGDGYCLLSSHPGQVAAARRGARGERDVIASIDGLYIVLPEPGYYEVTMDYDAVATVQTGTDLSGLPDFVSAGALYDASGERRSFELEGDILETDISGDLSLYYRARRSWTLVPNESAPGGKVRISFSDVAERAARLPLPRNVRAVVRQDPLAMLTLAGCPDGTEVIVDTTGLVTCHDGSAVACGHDVRSVMAAWFHVVCAGPSPDGDGAMVSLVEPHAIPDDGSEYGPGAGPGATGVVLTQQRFPNASVVGVTWTFEGELAVVLQLERDEDDRDVFEVHVLHDVRGAQSNGYVIL